jgi:hypothetical protein
MFRNEEPPQCSVQSSHILFNKGISFLMSLANETDGGRGTSFSVNDMRMPPANVMERVGSGVWGNDTGVGNKAVDDGSGAWGMNESVGCVAAPTFAVVFQKGLGGSTTLDGANRKSEAIVS